MKKRLLSIGCVVLVIILYLQYGMRVQILSTFNNTYQSQKGLRFEKNSIFIMSSRFWNHGFF